MRRRCFTLTSFIKAMFSLALFMFSTLPTYAHELWLEPVEYQVEPQGRLVVNIVNGQDFHGHRLPYLPQSSIRFDRINAMGTSPIEARAGDRPALDTEASDEGLQVLVYQAANATLTYHDGEKFWSFVEHKDLPVTREDHAARGLPDAEFKEVYSRYSKTMVAVGDGAGMDSNVGLLTEIVALANPYTLARGEAIPVQLLYQGQPRANAQIEVFEDDNVDTVNVSTIRTGADGIALLRVIPGMTYMLDAVVLRLPSDDLADETGAVYESLWANLTFHVPAND